MGRIRLLDGSLGPEVERESLVCGRGAATVVNDTRNLFEPFISADFIAEKVAVHLRQQDVRKDGIDRLALQNPQRFQAVGGFQRFEALTFKDQAQQFAIESVVIHEQDFSRHEFHFNCTETRSFNLSKRRPVSGRSGL
jgi:hypothetical protein